jgi:hypothetical protein
MLTDHVFSLTVKGLIFNVVLMCDILGVYKIPGLYFILYVADMLQVFWHPSFSVLSPSNSTCFSLLCDLCKPMYIEVFKACARNAILAVMFKLC